MEIPQGITVQVDGTTVTVKGPKGEVSKTFKKGTDIKVNGQSVEVSSGKKALDGTIEAVIRGMLKGAESGYSRNLKLLYAHFPISVEVKGADITIKNFLGEKQPRKAKLVGSTKLQVKGQAVNVSGPDKEAVGQTIANLRTAMKIKEKDGRVFQDGIYEIEGE